MAKPARSITANIIFVDDELYARVRRRESQQGLAHIDISESRQHYLGLPDGQLSNQHYSSLLMTTISHIVRRSNIDTIVTLGDSGYCGHSDHIASHRSALLAQLSLRQIGWHTELFSINNRGSGEFGVPVDRDVKLGALAFHRTQMHFDELADGTLQPNLLFFEKFQQTYGHLFLQETYDRLAALRYAA